MLDLTKILVNLGDELIFKSSEESIVTQSIQQALEHEESESYVSKRFSAGGYTCARFKAHQRLNDFEPQMAANGEDTLRLFKAGTAAHDIFQQQILSRTTKFFGTWVCASCGTMVENSFHPRETCTGSRIARNIINEESEETLCAQVLRKEKVKWVYRERYVYSNPLDDDLYAIAGFVDGIWIDDDTWYVLELKSADSLTFNSMYRTKHTVANQFVLKPTDSRHPIGSHISQGMVYSKLLLDEATSGKLPLSPETFGGLLLLYINRENFAVKEYKVEYTPHPYNELLHLAEAAKSAVEQNNEFLAPPKCTNATNVLAKKCPLRYKCFPKK